MLNDIRTSNIFSIESVLDVTIKTHIGELIGYVKEIHPMTDDSGNNKITISLVGSDTEILPIQPISAKIEFANGSFLKKIIRIISLP